MRQKANKQHLSIFAFTVTLLKLMTLFTATIRAEESSILDGATILNKEDFIAGFTPEPDFFIWDSFKTHLEIPDSSGLADFSKEVKI